MDSFSKLIEYKSWLSLYQRVDSPTDLQQCDDLKKELREIRSKMIEQRDRKFMQERDFQHQERLKQIDIQHEERMKKSDQAHQISLRKMDEEQQTRLKELDKDMATLKVKQLELEMKKIELEIKKLELEKGGTTRSELQLNDPTENNNI